MNSTLRKQKALRGASGKAVEGISSRVWEGGEVGGWGWGVAEWGLGGVGWRGVWGWLLVNIIRPLVFANCAH